MPIYVWSYLEEYEAEKADIHDALETVLTSGRYVVRHPQRDKIIAELKEKNTFVNVSYPHPIHTMTGYANLGYTEGDLPHTEQAAKEIFSLPMYPVLTNEQQDTVCETLHEILAKL